MGIVASGSNKPSAAKKIVDRYFPASDGLGLNMGSQKSKVKLDALMR
jgi:hypothetical protein